MDRLDLITLWVFRFIAWVVVLCDIAQLVIWAKR
jgi:hypothetical protein